jgi:hypothetical protein
MLTHKLTGLAAAATFSCEQERERKTLENSRVGVVEQALSLGGDLIGRQGDQIGRIFANWVVVYYGQ